MNDNANNVTTLTPRPKFDLAYPEISMSRLTAFNDGVELDLINFAGDTFEGDPKSPEGQTLAACVLISQSIGYLIGNEVARLPINEREAAINEIVNQMLAPTMIKAASGSAQHLNEMGIA